ncbi:MAG TPA: EAL domain-containing protein [Acidimicrobiales bacterium]|nr:EAL domain-containing protein [Acidimicrobiales bacterium]
MTDADMVEEVQPGSRWALVVAVAGAALLTADVMGLLGTRSREALVVLGGAGLVAASFGILRHRPRPVWPWLLQILALALFLAGGATRVEFGTLGDLSAHRSLVPDMLTLPGYVLLATSLVGLARCRRPPGSSDLDATLDAVIASIAALTVAWVYLINPALSEQHVPVSTRLLFAGYPAICVFLVAFGARIAFSSGTDRPLALRLLFVTLLCTLAGETIYMLVDAHIARIDPRFVDVPFGLAYVALMSGFLHPSIREVSRPVRRLSSEPRRGRFVFVAVALCVPAVVTLSRGERGLPDRVILAGVVIACTATAAWRMFRALRQHARAEARMAHQATHDALTGLGNRTSVRDHVDELLSQSGDETIALLFLDLDRFRLLNDSFGHGLGDELLTAVGARLEDNSRAGDLVARVGGDEFVIVARGVRELDHVRELAERTRLSLSRGFRVRDVEIPVSASVGVALHRASDPATSAEAMLRDADIAMYRAKDAGGDAVAVFDASMRQRVEDRLELENELRHALERGELHLAYQPIVRSQDGRITSLEALLRWSHPRLGEIEPSMFVPIAEDTGLIVDIGAWVLDRACADLVALREMVDHSDQLCVAVNLSARQLRDNTLLDHVARSLLGRGLPASGLRLELTESLVMENLALISKLLVSLRSCGVRISVDDFGTGYSSLATLDRLPVDEVKIDKSFVDGIAEHGANTTLVSAIVAIAESLGITTVAEGVERAEQADRLQALGCDQAQGFLFSTPVAFEELPGVISRLGLAAAPALSVVPDTA